jgi:hypothetical protein
MVWLVAVVGLALTIKREYLQTFVSLQTGCACAQGYFRDAEENDARRIQIFFCNERQWRAIRDAVRRWVLRGYAAWKALMLAWFTEDLQARIPDDFMPAEAVRDLDAHAPNGRRPTVQSMGMLRRLSHSAVVDIASDSDRGVRRPCERPNRPFLTDRRPSVTATRNNASILQGPAPTEPTSAAITGRSPRPFHIADDVRLWEIAGDAPERCQLAIRDDDEYQTMPEEAG